MDLKFSFQMASSSAGAQPEDSKRRRGGGLQLVLEIQNLTDARPEANLGDGSPAPGFGRDIQDPIGRTVSLGLQRRF